MKFKYLIFGCWMLGIIGILLLTRYWLPSDFTLVGHDSGLALSAGEFFKTRLFAWDFQDFGYDNSPHFGSLILHGIDYLTAIISQVPYAGNQLNVFLWFSLIFTAAFLFAYRLKDRMGKFSPIFFPVFVTFNFFILQSVFILERAKYSILVASLIVFWNITKITDKKLNLLVSAVLTAIGLTIFNSGSWLGLPLYGGLFVLVFSAFIFEFLWGLRDKNFLGLKRLTIYMFLTGLGLLLLNAYSIIPYLATFLKQDYSNLVNDTVINLNKAWLESLSQAGSFINFFKLQGIPDWYSSSYAVNEGHPYASVYLTNPILIFISLLFPILTFWSLVLAKAENEKRMISFLGLTALVSMVFMGGSHEPFGKLYEFLFTHLPGFAIFRSPYFKFASTFFIAVSGMMSFTLSKIVTSISSRVSSDKKVLLATFLSIVVVTGWFFYLTPVFTPDKIFEWQKGYSTKAKIPDYIKEFPNEVKKIDTEGRRILLAPPLNPVWTNDSYSWGYWSLTNLPSVLINKSLLTNDSGLGSEERSWVNSMYSHLKANNEASFLKIAKRLGVGYVLLRKDVHSDPSSWSAQEDPGLYENVTRNFKSSNKILSLGEWDLYRVGSEESKMITTKNDLVYIPSRGSYLSRTFIDESSSIIGTSLPPYLEPFIKEKLDIYNCQSCLLETKKPTDFLPTIRILPNSKLYYFKEYKENKTLKETKDDREKANAYMGFLLRRAAETMSMINYWAKEEETSANMKVMNNYLDSLQKMLTSTSNGAKDFEGASKVVDSLGPVEINFQAFTKRDDFGKKGEDFRQQILGVLWKIYNIKKFYSPILSDIERWEREKVYYITLNKAGSHDFYINLKSLPSDLDGKPIIPSKVEFVFDEVSQEISILEENGWLKFTLENKAPGEGEISLYFDDLPNLFDSQKESLLPLPTGEKFCVSGMIKNFRPYTPYRILIQANDNNENLKLIIKDNANAISEGNMFLHGENEITVEQNSINEPYGFLYHPETGGVDPAVFLCSSSKDLPSIKYIKVVEITTPSIVFADTFDLVTRPVPKVTYEKVNNTKYIVKIENAPESYILTFNQRYNSFWKIYKDDKEISGDQHFVIDGYANAWRLDQSGSYELTLEYSLQTLFYWGLGVTSVTLIIAIVFLINHKKTLDKDK